MFLHLLLDFWPPWLRRQGWSVDSQNFLLYWFFETVKEKDLKNQKIGPLWLTDRIR